MTQKQLLIPYGACDGRLVHISDVERGLGCGCTCPVCSEELIAKKGLKRVHHFSHQGDCNPETLAHAIGKSLLRDRLSKALETGAPVELSWSCHTCGSSHYGNVLERASRVEEEYNLGPCRPDLVLLGRLDRPTSLLEIVVTHGPEDYVKLFAKDRNIPIFEFPIETGEDLRALRNASPIPVRCDRCLRPKCPGCTQPMYEKFLEITPTLCWNCSRPMKAARIVVANLLIDPDYFTDQERNLARQNGAILEKKYSGSVLDTYTANSCPSCSSFIGQNYIHEIYQDADEIAQTRVGFGCPDCL